MCGEIKQICTFLNKKLTLDKINKELNINSSGIIDKNKQNVLKRFMHIINALRRIRLWGTHYFL